MKAHYLLVGILLFSLGCDDGGGGSGGTDPTVDAEVGTPPSDGGQLEADALRVDAAADAAPLAADAQRIPDAGCACDGRQTCEAGACAEPEICQGNEDCLDSRICSDSRCLSVCQQDADCAPELRCDPATRECTAERPCAGDAECGDTQICVEQRCADRCGEGSCPGQQICDDASGRCLERLEGCETDDDCAGERQCRNRACVLGCVDDAECSGAQSCVDTKCAEPEICNTDLDCTGDRRCTAGECNDPCTLLGCPDGLECDALSGRCAEASPCDGAADGCFLGRRCQAGQCVDPCVESAECPGAQRCVEGRCTEPEICTVPADCDPGRVCQTGRCSPHCEEAGCPGSMICARETGQCGEASPCIDSDGCLPGRRCEAGACVADCVENADCSGAMACLEGICTEPERCNGPFDCLEGRICFEGACRPSCDNNGDCDGSRRCEQSVCAEGADCLVDLDCDDPRRCLLGANVCMDSCDGQRPCADGFVCNADGICSEPLGCAADAQCLGERVCRLGACRNVSCEAAGDCGEAVCVDFRCMPDAPGVCDCAAGWQCGGGVCQQPGPCTRNDCPGGFVCAPSGLCAACATDGDCAAGRCDSGQCVDAEACAADADCAGARLCINGGCAIDIAACRDDALSGNNDIANALAVPQMVLQDLMACDGAPDWYRISSDAGQRVVARFDRDGAPLTMALFVAGAAELVPLDLSPGAPGETWVDAGPGDYLVRVMAAPGASRPYSLHVEASAACADDRYERPWRNDAPELARPVSAGRHPASLCGDDEDWFVYAGPGRVRVAIEGPVRATIEGVEVPAEGALAETPAQIHVTGAGEYTVVLTPELTPAQRCLQAPLVNIGDLFDAAVVAEDGDNRAAMCSPAGRPDRLFKIEVDRPGSLTAQLEIGAQGTALMLFEACEGPALGCSDASGLLENEVVPGTYYLAVDGAYAGTVQLEMAGGGAACELPAVLPTGQTAIQVGGAVGGLGGCVDDARPASAFRFELAERSQVRLALEGGGASARMSLRFGCADGNSELACPQAPDTLIDQPLGAGTYYVLVQGDGAMTANLTVDPIVQGGPQLEDFCLPGGGGSVVAAGQQLQIAGTLDAALDDFAADSCAGVAPGGADMAFRFRLDAPARVVADAQAGGFSPVLMLSDGECFALPICDDPPGGTLDVQLQAGAHAIIVDSDGAGAGEFVLNLEFMAP